jgi:glucose/arabinose dehydrogenase
MKAPARNGGEGKTSRSDAFPFPPNRLSRPASAHGRFRQVAILALTGFLALTLLHSVPGRAGTRSAAPLPSTPVVGLQLIASGAGSITSITNAKDSRLFLTIQTGQIRIRSGGSFLATPFLDISSSIACCGEQGLLSVAFHPRYATNGYFFVYYTNAAGNVEIARYQRSASNPNLADPATRAVLLTIPHPGAQNHNGGQLQFGPDGYLYIGTGDGGSGNDPPCNAQNDAVALGKMLRIDVDQNVNVSPFYGVPPSNPFAAQPFPRNITWAKGLRNPFRFSFDRVTGDLWIADVGQSAREEIDFQPQSSAGGQNYGWKVMEGSICGTDDRNGCNPLPPPCGDPSYTGPIYEYDHTFGCSVIGGYVYRGSQDLGLYGSYVYGDFCSGNLWGNGQPLTPTLPNLQTFGEDLSGEIYLGTGGGALYLLTHPGPPPPTPTPAARQFHTLTPCRVVDTRNGTSLYGGPSLAAGADRTFVFAGQCGIPASAASVTANVVAINPTDGPGFLTFSAGGSPQPLASTINYSLGKIRANNAIVPLGPVGEVTVHCGQGTGTADLVVDVTGYFQ